MAPSICSRSTASPIMLLLLAHPATLSGPGAKSRVIELSVTRAHRCGCELQSNGGPASDQASIHPQFPDAEKLGASGSDPARNGTQCFSGTEHVTGRRLAPPSPARHQFSVIDPN